MRQQRKRAAGFTFMEIMVSMMVFAIAMAALAAFYLSTARMNEQSRNLSQAMNDARVVMEMIRDTAQANGLTGPRGVTVTYPAGRDLAPTFGLRSLRNETVTVSYVNQASNPLTLRIQVQWLDRGWARTYAIDTMVTQR